MSIAAGWYADPAGSGGLRWWDGVAWTASTAPMPAPAMSPGDDSWQPINLLVPRARTLGTRALVWGIVALLLPIAFAPAIMAIVFGAMGLDYSRRLRSAGEPDPTRGSSIAGLVLGGLSLVAVFGFIVLAALAR